LGDIFKEFREKFGSIWLNEAPLGEMIRDIESFLIKALKSHGDAMYLAGAEAHREATRVEKKDDEFGNGCCKYNQAITEVSAKSEEFLNGLRKEE